MAFLCKFNTKTHAPLRVLKKRIDARQRRGNLSDPLGRIARRERSSTWYQEPTALHAGLDLRHYYSESMHVLASGIDARYNLCIQRLDQISRLYIMLDTITARYLPA
jgi:hypothetical protein